MKYDISYVLLLYRVVNFQTLYWEMRIAWYTPWAPKPHPSMRLTWFRQTHQDNLKSFGKIWKLEEILKLVEIVSSVVRKFELILKTLGYSNDFQRTLGRNHNKVRGYCFQQLWLSLFITISTNEIWESFESTFEWWISRLTWMIFISNEVTQEEIQ